MKYRKKPVLVEAYQTKDPIDIETLEGTMHASPGDYIITGVNGEKYHSPTRHHLVGREMRATKDGPA